MNKAFWKSANFWFGVVAVLTAIFGMSFPEQAGKDLVNAIIAGLAAINILYHYFRDLDTRPSFRDILKNPAFWASLVAVLISVFPMLPGAEIRALVDAILSGNVSLIINAVIGLGIALYKYFNGRKQST